MSALSRLKASPGLLVRGLVALGAVAAIAAGLAAFASRRVPLGADDAREIVMLVVVGALTRRYGIALPGNGFASYILGVTAYAILDRGWPFAVLVAPLAVVAGDLALRRLPVAAALDNAAHLTTGAALAGLAYARPGGGFAPMSSRSFRGCHRRWRGTSAWRRASRGFRSSPDAWSRGSTWASRGTTRGRTRWSSSRTRRRAIGRGERSASTRMRGSPARPCGCGGRSWATRSPPSTCSCRGGNHPARSGCGRCTTPDSWWACGACGTRIPPCTVTPTPTCWSCWRHSWR